MPERYESAAAAAAAAVNCHRVGCLQDRMHYAEMPQDVSCDSLSAYRAVEKTYQNGDCSELRLELQLPEDAYLKKKGFNKTVEKSPEKGNAFHAAKNIVTRHSFRNGENGSNFQSGENRKKISAPAVFCGYSKVNFDDEK